MKTSLIAVTGAATNIRATITAKFVTVTEDGEIPSKSFIVNFLQPDGTYSADVQFAAGAKITHVREDGIICRPPGYSAYQVPLLGEAYMKVRTSDASGVNVRLLEYENIPRTSVL